ncbi:MAG TPA: hypothetical protein VEA59_02200 [Patescibacteria group bacterium]|nr:hypothetical protein [Patescibacteria group bacterium]
MKKITYFVLALVLCALPSLASAATSVPSMAASKMGEKIIGTSVYHYTISASNFTKTPSGNRERYTYTVKAHVMRCNTLGMNCQRVSGTLADYREAGTRATGSHVLSRAQHTARVNNGTGTMRRTGYTNESHSYVLFVRSGSRLHEVGTLWFSLIEPTTQSPVPAPTVSPTPVLPPLLTPSPPVVVTPAPVTPVPVTPTPTPNPAPTPAPNPEYILNSGTLLSQYISSGAQNVPIAAYHFASTTGSFRITEMKFMVDSSPAGIYPITGIRVGNVTAPVINGVAYLTGLDILVPISASGIDVQAYANFNTVGVNGVIGTGGAAPSAQVSLIYTKYVTSSGSGELTTPVTTGQPLYLVGAKPTITVSSPGGSLTTSPSVPVADITISNTGPGDIRLQAIPLSISFSQGVGGAATVNSVTLAETNGSSIPTVSTAMTPNGATATFSSPYTISAGGSKTFRVFANVGGNIGTSAVLSVGLDTTTAGRQAFTWYDVNGAASLTGEFIYSYPITTSSVRN